MATYSKSTPEKPPGGPSPTRQPLDITTDLLLRRLEVKHQISLCLYSVVRDVHTGDLLFDMSLAHHNNRLCLEVKENKTRHRRCMEYKNAKISKAFETNRSYFDLCPFGVLDAVIPFPKENPVFILFISDARKLYGRRRPDQSLLPVQPATLSPSPGYLEQIDSIQTIVEGFLSSQSREWMPPPGGSVLSKKVAMAKHRIQYDFRSDLSLEMVAKDLHLSKSHLARAYKKIWGKTFHEDLNQHRVMRAQELIFCGASVTEAAHEVGYHDAGYFHRVFKRLHGVGPREWKKNRVPKTLLEKNRT